MDGLSPKNSKGCYANAALPKEEQNSNLINDEIKSEESKLFHKNKNSAGVMENEEKYKEPVIKNIVGSYKVKYVHVKNPKILDFSEDV